MSLARMFSAWAAILANRQTAAHRKASGLRAVMLERDEYRSNMLNGAALIARQKDLLDEGVARIRELKNTIALLEAQNETEGPKRDLENSNDAQAARAMSRQTKDAFRQYQEGVKALVDTLDPIAKKNRISVNDMAQIQLVRRELRAMLKREI